MGISLPQRLASRPVLLGCQFPGRQFGSLLSAARWRRKFTLLQEVSMGGGPGPRGPPLLPHSTHQHRVGFGNSTRPGLPVPALPLQGPLARLCQHHRCFDFLTAGLLCVIKAKPAVGSQAGGGGGGSHSVWYWYDSGLPLPVTACGTLATLLRTSSYDCLIHRVGG